MLKKTVSFLLISAVLIQSDIQASDNSFRSPVIPNSLAQEKAFGYANSGRSLTPDYYTPVFNQDRSHKVVELPMIGEPLPDQRKQVVLPYFKAVDYSSNEQVAKFGWCQRKDQFKVSFLNEKAEQVSNSLVQALNNNGTKVDEADFYAQVDQLLEQRFNLNPVFANAEERRAFKSALILSIQERMESLS